MSSNDNNKDMKIDSTSSDELCWCHFCKGYPIPTDSFPHLCCIRDVSDMFGTADSESESEENERDEEDEEGDEWDTICNEDYKEVQVDENGRKFYDYLTYGGGPVGGYMVYTDTNCAYSWHYELGFDKRRLTQLQGKKLIIRRNPDMPSNYKGAQGFQVRAVKK